MSQVCTVCQHAERATIDAAIVAGAANRRIATQHGLSEAAVRRHRASHLPAHLAHAQEAETVAQADNLLAQVRALRSKAVSILLKAERAGDYRTALAGIREARACLELLLEVEGQISRQPVSVLISPQWLEVRAVIVAALAAHPEARLAVARQLSELEGGRP